MELGHVTLYAVYITYTHAQKILLDSYIPTNKINKQYMGLPAAKFVIKINKIMPITFPPFIHPATKFSL